jgi:hypothetical protein
MNDEKYYVRRYSPGWAIYSRSTPACPVRLYGLTGLEEVMRICEEMNMQEHCVIPDLQVPPCFSGLPVHRPATG